MALIETTVTKEHDDELDSRVELTEAGMVMMQLARIEEAMKRTKGATLTFDPLAEGWTLDVVAHFGRQTFTVHGESLVDVLAQAAQVLEVE
jgi:aryl carrier-like protein